MELLNNKKEIDKPIYIFTGYYDSREDCYGPCFGDPDSYIYAEYENIKSSVYNRDNKSVLKKDMSDFEKDKIIIKAEMYVTTKEVKNIFNEELNNINNKTIYECIEETRKRIKNLSYLKSPEYKEKVLLDKIHELYNKVNGKFIKKEILYSGKFLDILREIYKLPNEKIVEKEKVIKNNGKDSVIVISITKDNEYIITFQNRIKDKIIAEFPSGYIESNEDVIEAVKRELKEETGYISNNIYIIDQAYTSPGIDNSITYIVIAKDCFKEEKTERDSNELISFDLFSEKELEYLIKSNIMNGALNKLAYYNLISNSKKYNKTSNQCLQKILL